MESIVITMCGVKRIVSKCSGVYYCPHCLHGTRVFYKNNKWYYQEIDPLGQETTVWEAEEVIQEKYCTKCMFCAVKGGDTTVWLPHGGLKI